MYGLNFRVKQDRLASKAKRWIDFFEHTLSSMVHHPQGKTSWLKAAG
jgi:hypothetical protein